MDAGKTRLASVLTWRKVLVLESNQSMKKKKKKRRTRRRRTRRRTSTVERRIEKIMNDLENKHKDNNKWRKISVCTAAFLPYLLTLSPGRNYN